jgi:isoamylase
MKEPKVNNPLRETVTAPNDAERRTKPAARVPRKRLAWEQGEGAPLPLGVTWIEQEQAFNFAVHAEPAESVTLLFYASGDLVNPLLEYRFDFLHHKSGRVWHCRIPASQLADCSYYGYSVSGQAVPYLHSFDPQKVLFDPYAQSRLFPSRFRSSIGHARRIERRPRSAGGADRSAPLV